MLFHRFRALFSPLFRALFACFGCISSPPFSLVFICHRPNRAKKLATTPSSQRPTKHPDANWRELRPSSELRNSLSKNSRELRPSNGLQSSLPKNDETSVLLVTYKTTCQKNGAGSIHGDSDRKHFSDSAAFRKSVRQLPAMISAVNSTCLCFCFSVVFCCCCFCFCSAGRVHGGKSLQLFGQCSHRTCMLCGGATMTRRKASSISSPTTR